MSTAEKVSIAISCVALVATTGSVLVAILIWRADRRAKRIESTLRAWSEWQTATLEDRRLVFDRYSRQIPPDQAEALRAKKAHGSLPPPEGPERKAILQAMTSTLNSLERLAVGTRMNLYDLATLDALGGSIILRWHRRLVPYIASVRRARNSDAWTSFESLANDIDARRSTHGSVRGEELAL